MILAVYTKKKTSDKWSLYALAESMEVAKKYKRTAVKKAKRIGFDEADSVIQGFETSANIPKNLDTKELKPETLFYN